MQIIKEPQSETAASYFCRNKNENIIIKFFFHNRLSVISLILKGNKKNNIHKGKHFLHINCTVQKLRKTAGLVVADKVEIFYEESVEDCGINSISAAMLKHSAATVKRIKSLPLDYKLCSKQAVVIIKEIVNDTDII